MNNKTSIITGIRGQLGSYLSELLLAKNYRVVGIERRSSSPDYSNIAHLLDNKNFSLEQGDITDFGSIARIVQQYKPDEFYNLAAQSFVAASWDQPIATSDINYMGVANCLEAIRLISPKTKFYQSSTSEVFGDVLTNKQNEDSPLRPRSPYGASKAGAESLVKVYRDSYNMFACFSRNFNFESPRRAKQFVTRKITDYIGKMVNPNIPTWMDPAFLDVVPGSSIKPLHLGNLDAKRDWSFAGDIAEAIWMMMQEDEPDTYVFGSGKARTIKDFLSIAFSHVYIDDWSKLVVVDPQFYRPAEVNTLCADPQKAWKKLGWYPKVTFDQLVEAMVKNDVLLYRKENVYQSS